ncbi:MAG: hypothetical protein AB7F89_20475 [Pirellulaceae bacterium]
MMRDAGDYEPETAELADGTRWPAWLLSVVLHATVLIACGLLAPVIAQPPPGEPDRSVGIALVARESGDESGDRQDHTALAESVSGQSTVPSGAVAEQKVISQLPSVDSFTGQLAASLPQAVTAGQANAAGVGLPNASGFTASNGTGQGRGTVGGQARTQVFGAGGQGSKFLYVFDRSASMGGFEGRPLAAAKAELLKSLADLGELHQFQIVFYNDHPFIFNPAAPSPPTILFASEENRRLASDFVARIQPVGGTHHREALEAALRMGPDVIFFLTDAHEPELSPGEIADLSRRNRASAIINCIEFGVGSFTGGENFLVRLARSNRGQHVYVDVTTLGRGK